MNYMGRDLPMRRGTFGPNVTLLMGGSYTEGLLGHAPGLPAVDTQCYSQVGST